MNVETQSTKQKKALKGNETTPGKVRRPQHTDFMQKGREYPDPTPIAPPLGFIKQPTLAETMRQMIRSEALKNAARESGHETFEEADDFDVGDDYDPRSPYEETFDPPVDGPNPEEIQKKFIDDLSKGIRNAFQEERPDEGRETPPENSGPPPPAQEGGREPAPKSALHSFIDKATKR